MHYTKQFKTRKMVDIKDTETKQAVLHTNPINELYKETFAMVLISLIIEVFILKSFV